MSKGCVIITGGSGGVGTAVKKSFFENGYRVISIDKKSDSEFCHEMITFNIKDLASNDNHDSVSLIRERLNECQKGPIKALINNAGLQIVKPLLEVTTLDINESIATNMTASLVLSQILYKDLVEANGAIINIGSVHASQSKPNFGAYSISKTALVGLTKAMAIEFGEHITVTSVDPAAVDTKMLRAGLENDVALINKLLECHPTKSIASTVEVASLVYFLVDAKIKFINGSCISLDGGISKLLNDPALF